MGLRRGRGRRRRMSPRQKARNYQMGGVGGAPQPRRAPPRRRRTRPLLEAEEFLIAQLQRTPYAAKKLGGIMQKLLSKSRHIKADRFNGQMRLRRGCRIGRDRLEERASATRAPSGARLYDRCHLAEGVSRRRSHPASAHCLAGEMNRNCLPRADTQLTSSVRCMLPRLMATPRGPVKRS